VKIQIPATHKIMNISYIAVINTHCKCATAFAETMTAEGFRVRLTPLPDDRICLVFFLPSGPTTACFNLAAAKAGVVSCTRKIEAAYRAFIGVHQMPP
jgi:hypothetical protein